MFVNYPHEWERYMVPGEVRTFKSDTPKEIIEEAKKINVKSLEYEDKPYFYFSKE